MMTTIFGTKVSVISCTRASAWKSAMATPTTIAATIAGPDAAITVQKRHLDDVERIRLVHLENLDPVADKKLRAAFQGRDHAGLREGDGRDSAAVAPSADASVRPMIASAWDSIEFVIRASSLAFV